jgi:hypothetical protein
MKNLLINIFKIFRNPIDILLSIVIVPGAYLFLLFRRTRASRLPLAGNRLKNWYLSNQRSLL